MFYILNKLSSVQEFSLPEVILVIVLIVGGYGGVWEFIKRFEFIECGGC